VSELLHRSPHRRIIQSETVTARGRSLDVPRCFLDQTLIDITQFVHGRPTEVVFNLDEVHISEWEDQKTKTVIVPKSMSEQMMQDKVNRNLKHVSVIGHVSAAGKSFIPDIVTFQDSTHVREQLKKYGVDFDTDFILKDRANPHINAKIFLEDIRALVLPNLNER
jgi:hypothetical protein